MMRALIAVMILCSLFSAEAAAPATTQATQPAAGWNPDKFPISFWCGPPSEFVKPERFKQIADANFTIVFPPCGPTTVEVNRKVLDYSQQYGLKAFVMDPRMPSAATDAESKKKIDAIIADYSKHPALAGYFIGDEPGAGAYPAIASVVQYFREKDPAHPAFYNLYPNYAPLWALATPTYDDYIARYIQIVKPAIVSYDHYHFHKKFDAPGFFANLQTVRDQTVAANLPFWNIVLAVNHFDYRSPTESELRWEAMQTLAFGGKGVLFFTYWQPAQDATGTWGEAIINYDGTPTPKYEMITRVNHDVQAIGKYLLHATSTSTFQYGQDGDHTNTGKLPIRFDGTNITVGLFTQDKTHYALFANRDYKKDVSTDVFLDTKGAAVKKLDKKTDQWADIETAAKGESKVPLKINAGDAELSTLR